MTGVIVTGGLGFIGSHTVRRLAESSLVDKIFIIDNLYSGSIRNIDDLPREKIVFRNIDVCSYRGLLDAFRGFRGMDDILAVIHLAAVISLMEAEENPRNALRVNHGGTINILETMRRLDIDKIIYASSVAVYGEPMYLPIDEGHPLRPINIYGLSKKLSEDSIISYSRSHGLRAIILRYFNVYGPGMRPGEYAGVIYRFIEARIRGRRGVIHGDGEQTRDFIYVTDVADANIKALNVDYTGAINIGSGEMVTINKLYRMIFGDVEPIYSDPRPRDIRRSMASIDRAMKILGWRPRIGLRDGLKYTKEYYRNIVK